MPKPKTPSRKRAYHPFYQVQRLVRTYRGSSKLRRTYTVWPEERGRCFTCGEQQASLVHTKKGAA